MLGGHGLVWKLGAVVLIMVVVMIVGSGLLGGVLSRHFALESARQVLRFNSISIRSGIEKLMMSRNNAGVLEFVKDISRGSSVYHDIRLVSHPAGEIAVSRITPPETRMRRDERSCSLCHAGAAQPKAAADPLDFVFTVPEGERYLHVVTPILNAPGCQAADCHAHDASGPILGFLQTDYSLAGVDTLISGMNLSIALAALVAVVLTTSAVLIVFRRYLGNPVRSMVAGLGALAADDLGFRFPAKRKDEIGLVEESFNRMAARIQTHQEELRKALEYLEGIVENSADLIITVNPEGLIQTFNRGAEIALSYQRDEVIGRPVEMLFADPRERQAALTRLMETDNVTNYETRLLAKGGEIRHVLLTLSRLRDKDGNPIGTYGISKDVSKEKELQRKLLQSEQAAAIGRAVTGIQHAIKNMLNTLVGGLYVARVGLRKGDVKQAEEGCDMIDEGLSRISDLSLNMLKYAREWTIEPELTDLVRLAEKVVAAVKQTASERGVTLAMEATDSVPMVACDQRLIHMGLMDIVTNALEACESKEYDGSESPEIRLRVALASVERDVIVEVQDNGVGMSQEVLTNVFTPFFSTKKKWGTGLGLALTARVIELHDGKVSVESEPDKGTTFRIRLPLSGPGTNRRGEDGQKGPSY